MQSDIGGWIRDVRTAMEQGARYGLLFGVYYVLVGLWLTVSTRIQFGTQIYERDWDLLLVLDACRVDALAAVADEYDFLEEPTAVWSVGSTSSEWISHTFDRQYATEISGTAYVTANPHSKPLFEDRAFPPQYTAVPFTCPDWNPVEEDAFLELDEVWRYGHDEQLGVVPPATTTDRAISVGRELDPDRLLVHYMQPHAPYIAAAVESGDPERACREPLDDLQRGRLRRTEVWEAYLDNLRLVLDEIERLRENVDAERVVITADHGEAFGEFGFHEHPLGCPHPVVKRVPWVETTTIDRETSLPGEHESRSPDVEAQLADLGYL